MKEDFELIKQKIRIEEIAQHLLGKPLRNMYYYPGEKTPSIKVYQQSQSFYDFGRGCGGDLIRLWSHVCQVDSWTALNEIKTLYSISDSPDKKNIRACIQQQEQERQAIKRADEKQKEQWRKKVNSLKAELTIYENLLELEHIPPLSWGWCECINRSQLLNYKLDCLCGVDD